MNKNKTKKTSGYDDALLKCLTADPAENRKMALATIISRRGSAPREIGTKMIVTPDGKTVGTIGGGCMESRIIHQCLSLLREDTSAFQSRVVQENMTAQEAGEEGLVCGGAIQVYLEVF